MYVHQPLCTTLPSLSSSPSLLSLSLFLLLLSPQFYFGAPDQILPGLTRWKSPQHPLHIYGAGNFRVFLPPSSPASYPLGETYHIIEPLRNELGVHMNRYRPPRPLGKADSLLYALLSQFHPNPFVQTRFGPRGTVAVVRARNNSLLDIVFRSVHMSYS